MGGGDCERFLPQDLGDILRNWDKKTESTLHREVLLKNRSLRRRSIFSLSLTSRVSTPLTLPSANRQRKGSGRAGRGLISRCSQPPWERGIGILLRTDALLTTRYAAF